MKFLIWYSVVLMVITMTYVLIDALTGVDVEDSVIAIVLFAPTLYYLFHTEGK